MLARALLSRFLFPVVFLAATAALAQQPPGVVPGLVPGTTLSPPRPYQLITPAVQPTLSPGAVLLMGLEGRFAESVAAGGGKAFATWFAEDAVTLNEGKPAVLGRGAIAAQATWSPATYSLTWIAQGAEMGPSNDMGFTWGHYQGRAFAPDGKATITSGRYITIWKKLADGTWKVAMDASASEPPAPEDCCTVPKS